MLETTTHGDWAIGARSSGLAGPQMNCTSPSGSHCASAGAAAVSSTAPAINVPSINRIRMRCPPSSPQHVAGIPSLLTCHREHVQCYV